MSTFSLALSFGAAKERAFTSRRVYKKDIVNSVTTEILYLHDGMNAIVERNKTGTPTEYIHGPTGIIAIKTPSSMNYVLKDHLGSTRVMINTTEQPYALTTYDYSAFGTILTTPSSTAYLYTGQEWDQTSGLHNFKARMYDSDLGAFYTRDPAGMFGSAFRFKGEWDNDSREYDQNSQDSLGVNELASPYMFAGNNPVRYTDANGEFFIIDDYAIGFVKGAFQGKNPFKTGWKHAENSALIWGGLFQGSPSQILSRFTWELPQTIVGFTGAHGTNMIGNVKSVKYFDGATVLRTSSKGYWGITLGSYIIGSREIKAGPGTTLGHRLFMHEYGHYLQSQRSGPLYLTKYGVPSLLNAAFGWGGSNHKTFWAEKDANLLASRYFEGEHGFTQWSDYYNPRSARVRNPGWWEYPLWPIAYFWNF
jgi:RHS repeat-associated protein